MKYYETVFMYPSFMVKMWVKGDNLTEAAHTAHICLLYDDALQLIGFRNPEDGRYFGYVTRDSEFEFTSSLVNEEGIETIGEVDSELYISSKFKTYVINIKINGGEFIQFKCIGLPHLKHESHSKWIRLIEEHLDLCFDKRDKIEISISAQKNEFENIRGKHYGY